MSTVQLGTVRGSSSADSGVGRRAPVRPSAPVVVEVAAPPPTIVSRVTKGIGRMMPAPRMPVPRGFLPLLLYSSLAFALPMLYHYMDYDYEDDMTRAVVIGTSVVSSTVVLLAMDCAVWFNIVLFFHAALEVRVIHRLVDVAQADGSSDMDVALSWTAAGVIGVHLLPFLVVDGPRLLALVGYAGVIVNSAALLYVDTDLLPLVAYSASVLLGSTLCISYTECIRTSMLSGLRHAMSTGTYIECK